MWYEKIDRIEFLQKLYNEIPELENVRIERVTLEREGKIVVLVFDMPCYADNPPLKWKGCNTVSIEIAFSSIEKLQLKYEGELLPGNIHITNNDKYLVIEINGMIICSFSAEYAFIQSVSAYEV